MFELNDDEMDSLVSQSVIPRPLNFSVFGLSCHSRESGNPVFSSTSWIPAFAGMTKRLDFQRSQSKEDVFEGAYSGRTRVVIVPRNKRSIPQGTLNSIWRQAGINKEIAENLWTKR